MCWWFGGVLIFYCILGIIVQSLVGGIVDPYGSIPSSEKTNPVVESLDRMQKRAAEDVKLKINYEPTWYRLSDALILGSPDMNVCSATEYGIRHPMAWTGSKHNQCNNNSRDQSMIKYFYPLPYRGIIANLHTLFKYEGS